MKRSTLILLCTILSCSLYAQPTKKVTNEIGDKWRPIKEIYYVLKSDMTTRQGSYQIERHDQKILQGYYNNGKKDSVWENYGVKNVVLTRRWYNNGAPKGIWEFNTFAGEPDWRYDFTTMKVDYLKRQLSDTATYYYFTTSGELTRGSLDSPPICLMGSTEWLNFLNRTLRYPDEAVNNMQQGKVVVGITIDETGNAVDYSVFQGAAPALNQEALRVVKRCEVEYIPAVKDGKKVKSMYLMPIQFKLEVAN